MTLRERYPRTGCSCRKCQLCCKVMPGRLAPEDLPHFDASDLRASRGALVVLEGRPLRIPSIVPAVQDNGSCIFLKDGLCTVHEFSPFGCAAFDTHMDERMGTRRSEAMLKACLDDRQADGPYYQLWQQLAPAETPAEDRSARLRREMDRLERKRKRRK